MLQKGNRMNTPEKFYAACEYMVRGADAAGNREKMEAFEIAQTVYEGYFGGVRSRAQFAAFILALLWMFNTGLPQKEKINE